MPLQFAGRLPRLFGRGLPHLVDQGLSSASNVLAVVMVARALGAEGFGHFAVVFAVMTLVLGVVRGLFGTRIALTASADDARSVGAGVLGILVVVAVPMAAVVGVASVLLVGRLDNVAAVVAVTTPIVCAQDVLRHVAMASGRPGVAVWSDGFWCLALLGPLLAGWRPSAALTMVVWSAAAVLSLAVAAVGLRLVPRFSAGRALLGSRVPVAESVALAALTGSGAALAVSAIAAAVVGPAAAGALRGASTLMGPLSSLFAWSAIALTPVVVRRDRAQWARSCGLIGLGMGAVAVCWTLVVLLIPDEWGRAVLAESWDGARSVLPWTGVEYVALAVGAGATLGLKVRGYAMILTQQKTVYAGGAVALASAAAVWLGSPVAVAAALAVAAVAATLVAWVRLVRSSGTSGSRAFAGQG